VRDIYTIRTPENVTFEFELASVASRAIAWFLDVVVMVVAIVLVSCVASLGGGLGNAVLFVAIFLIQWWYSALCEWFWGGQTIGKRVVGLRTIQLSGVRITFFQAVVRNLVRIVDILPALYFAGGVTALIDKHGRRLGDLAAGTIVVRERRAPLPSAIVSPTERHNSFVQDPHVIHATRRITPPERDAMVALSLRREELALPIRRDLFRQLSQHLERRLGIERPHFFSEERFVLNLTAVAVAGLSERRSIVPAVPRRR
jgi:uncharacterized RDD family membrane protein YckC